MDIRHFLVLNDAHVYDVCLMLVVSVSHDWLLSHRVVPPSLGDEPVHDTNGFLLRQYCSPGVYCDLTKYDVMEPLFQSMFNSSSLHSLQTRSIHGFYAWLLVPPPFIMITVFPDEPAWLSPCGPVQCRPLRLAWLYPSASKVMQNLAPCR